MEEPKFRGISKNTGEFVYGDYCSVPEPNIVFINDKSEIDCEPIYRDTLGKYIGVDDCCGTEIYSDDILSDPSWWWGNCFVYASRCGDNVLQYILAKNINEPLKNASWNLWGGNDVRVVGSIHKSPWLLNEGKKPLW